MKELTEIESEYYLKQARTTRDLERATYLLELLCLGSRQLETLFLARLEQSKRLYAFPDAKTSFIYACKPYVDQFKALSVAERNQLIESLYQFEGQGESFYAQHWQNIKTPPQEGKALCLLPRNRRFIKYTRLNEVISRFQYRSKWAYLTNYYGGLYLLYTHHYHVFFIRQESTVQLFSDHQQLDDILPWLQIALARVNAD